MLFLVLVFSAFLIDNFFIIKLKYFTESEW